MAGKVFVPQCALAVPIVSEGINCSPFCECVLELARRDAQPFTKEEVAILVEFAHRVRGILTNFASWVNHVGKEVFNQSHKVSAEHILSQIVQNQA